MRDHCFEISSGSDLIELGHDGSWMVPSDLIRAESIVVCAGCGDGLFLRLIADSALRLLGLRIRSDSARHRACDFGNQGVPKYRFRALGIWSHSDQLRLFAPRDITHVSHSAVNLQGTKEHFEAEVDRLSTIMKREGHARIDLLKLDSLHEDELHPRVLCVDFDEHFNPLDADYGARIRSATARLLAAGYVHCHTTDNAKYALVRSSS
jgi:hypothetical protein